MIRDILNYNGDKIGELELPDDTPEEIWAARLEPYLTPPPSPEEQMQAALSRTVAESRKIADDIMGQLKVRNLAYFIENNVSNDLAIMKSLWTHHRLRAASITVGGVPFVIDVLNLVVSGDLETAWVVLGAMEPDDMSQPFHFLEDGVLIFLRQLLGERIGLA